MALAPLLEPALRRLRRLVGVATRSSRREEAVAARRASSQPLAEEHEAPATASNVAASREGASRPRRPSLAAAEEEVSVQPELEGEGGEGVAVHERRAAGGEEALSSSG